MYEFPTIQPFKDRGRWYWMNTSDFWVTLEAFAPTMAPGPVNPLRFEFMVPGGFYSDLASIPKLAQWVFFLNPYEPAVVWAALAHDWLTPTEDEVRRNAPFCERPLFTPQVSSGVFYELMRRTEVPLWRRRIYFHAVNLAIKEW